MYPLSLAMLHRPLAAVWERYLSSRSPPDHLLYQMLKMVPVWGGGSDLISAGSICGRAGRFLRRMIFLTFLPAAAAAGCGSGSTTSVGVVLVSASSSSWGAASSCASVDVVVVASASSSSWGAASCTSAMFAV